MPLLKTMMKSLFKADHPYRTRLGLSATITTSAAGILNLNIANTGLSSTQEWTSIDALFDEFYIHSHRIIFRPINAGGGGGETPATGSVGGMPTFAAAAGIVISSGVQGVAMQGASGAYTSAVSMLSHPSCRHFESNRPWTFTWRNNVRFDPHGYSLSGVTSGGWQGWSEVGAVSTYGGFSQFRTSNDFALGDEAHAFAIGTYAIIYDVSFRVRA